MISWQSGDQADLALTPARPHWFPLLSFYFAWRKGILRFCNKKIKIIWVFERFKFWIGSCILSDGRIINSILITKKLMIYNLFLTLLILQQAIIQCPMPNPLSLILKWFLSYLFIFMMTTFGWSLWPGPGVEPEQVQSAASPGRRATYTQPTLSPGPLSPDQHSDNKPRHFRAHWRPP